MMLRQCAGLFSFLAAAAAAYDRDDVDCAAHSDGICRPDEYCALYDGTSWETWCIHCVNCAEDGWPDGAPVDDTCPAKCDCRSDDDCPRGSHCETYEDGYGDPIRTCETCGAESSGVAQCSCVSSDECGTGYFCGVLDEDSYDWSATYPTCYRCNDESAGCADFVLLEGESCRDACPDQYECGEHADCAAGEFCAQNHRCRGCRTGECWTPSRDTLSLDGVWFSSRFTTSIDFGCPEECCDWGLSAPPYWGPFNLATSIGPCEEAIRIEAFWADGDKTEWMVGDFVEKGNACTNKRYEFTDGMFPPAVTTVDCFDQLEPPSCSTRTSTMALVAWNGSRPVFVELKSVGNGTVDSQDLGSPPLYPVVHLFDARSDTCGLSDAVGTLAAIGAGIGIAVACIIGLCIFVILTCIFCNRRQRHG
mmetsp:Transcript_43790/g.93107  ORF Transcript_43790/g.93107 Transcript_43790/m.93107 type:complete len:420 (+) Transcript_43790:59-1318(+)|eukprot:CAMPEP_0172553412 /NCGR_PEP_ID=MMETSP1067-20121228/50743_1 /TAXON_ID=265564 ORGANISM="Thalassiosira punctigera, Strain Tpunct2005C2" /NCGR_SAMPLE_ID=MMETSP1067 /ASSEMBLY_ACC=CAM_ASM_000444 /LENGTH=419 /DNA_ID=CAMNT_0013341599 /DNA_START=58 /DNA_END=1317 /DNA_ORIENTATION=+